MKSSFKVKLGKILMSIQPLTIQIYDDQEAYFNEQMISLANEVGFKKIERESYITQKKFKEILKNPPSVIILDIKGIVEPALAKDGLEIANIMYDKTKSFVVVTSAHQYHLKNRIAKTDYIIENRTLTAIDFIEELDLIVGRCLKTKYKFYQKFVFRIGFKLIKHTLTLN